MKRVVKRAEPRSFIDWKNQASAEWQPTYEALQNPEKRELHEALLAEQGGVCCYCGRAITLEDSHIEHFRPQEARADLALDYANLHASCIRAMGPGLPLHCGHAKGNAFDEHRAISPQAPDCERRYIYSGDGAISPADENDACARYMSDLLKLDLRFLRNRRAAAIGSVFDDAFLGEVSDDELALLAAGFRDADASGRLTEFGHVLARFAEQQLGHRVE